MPQSGKRQFLKVENQPSIAIHIFQVLIHHLTSNFTQLARSNKELFITETGSKLSTKRTEDQRTIFDIGPSQILNGQKDLV